MGSVVAWSGVLEHLPGVDEVEVGGCLGVKDGLAGRLVHIHGVGEEGVGGHLVGNGCGVHRVLDGAGYDGVHLAVAGHTAEVTLIGLHVVVSDSGYIGVAGCWVQGGLGGALVHLPVVGEVGVVGNLGVAGCGVQDICRNNAIHIVDIITAMLIAFIFIII